MDKIKLLQNINKKIADKLAEVSQLMEARSKYFHETKKIDDVYRDYCRKIDMCWGYIDALEDLERML